MPEILSLYNQDKHSNASSSSKVGQIGEQLAADFLLKKGFRPVAANFKIPIGRNRVGASVTGEIELSAYDGDVLCFVEVKTRSSDEFASPLAAVDLRKQRQIIRAARMYRKVFRLNDVKFRYDVVSVILENVSRPKIEIFKSYWSEIKFSKKVWFDDFR